MAAVTNAGFSHLPLHRRPGKPRSRGLTSIRGPYYAPVGRTYLADLLDAIGHAIDSLKYAGGSFVVLRAEAVCALNDMAHDHEVLVSTGGFLERVVAWGDAYVEPYLRACRTAGFDIVEVSAGFVPLDDDRFVELVERVRAAGLRVVAEVGIQRGAGGASTIAALERAGTIDPDAAATRAERALDAGAELVMVESEGITEQVREWRTDAIDTFIHRLGLDRLMFEAADPHVFDWYVRTYGRDVNLFVDHSQVVHLETLRAGAWGTAESWGRIS